MVGSGFMVDIFAFTLFSMVSYCMIWLIVIVQNPPRPMLGDLSPFCESAHVCPEIGYL
jgi:hypothetical protein